jgi:hypothetical protein
MEKSIETIWKEGFLKNDALLAPKLNNLYNQKSKQLIEKIKKTTRVDNLSLLPIAFILLVVLSYLGFILAGIYASFLLIFLFFLNKKLLKSLNEININTNNHQYLIAYKNAIGKIISFTTKLLGFGLPLAVIPIYWLFFKETKAYQKLIAETPFFFIILFVIGIAILLSILGVLIYKLSTKIIYGNFITKLDEIITDIEELKN